MWILWLKKPYSPHTLLLSLNFPSFLIHINIVSFFFGWNVPCDSVCSIQINNPIIICFDHKLSLFAKSKIQFFLCEVTSSYRILCLFIHLYVYVYMYACQYVLFDVWYDIIILRPDAFHFKFDLCWSKSGFYHRKIFFLSVGGVFFYICYSLWYP